jgi:hypothetical protein
VAWTRSIWLRTETGGMDWIDLAQDRDRWHGLDRSGSGQRQVAWTRSIWLRIGTGGMDWIDLAQDRDRWHGLDRSGSG